MKKPKNMASYIVGFLYGMIFWEVGGPDLSRPKSQKETTIIGGIVFVLIVLATISFILFA